MTSLAMIAILVGAVSTTRGDSTHRVAQPRPAPAITAQAVDSFADEYFRRALADTHTPGAVFVFVAGGKVIASRGYGDANRESHTRVDAEHTLWRLASTSKSLTALAVLRLVERGRLQLDSDVNAYLRAFKVPAGFGAPITLRELLLHTSGLDDRLMGDGFLDGTPPSLTQVMTARLPRRIRPPGAFLYGNYDYGVLGAVIEEVSGMPFAAFERDSVLLPMGMRDATFEQPLASAAIAIVAMPYGFSGGAYQPLPVVYHQSSPGGGATATGGDMGRYLEFLLGSERGTSNSPVSRRAVHDVFGLDGITDTTFFAEGFGWRSRLWNGERIVETGGDLPGYNNILVLLPERQVGFFIAINSGRGAATIGFLWAFLDHFFPHAPPATYRDNARARALPSTSFAGSYRPARYPHFELSKLGIIASETRVAADSGGALRFWGQRWTRVGQLEFQRAAGPLASGPLVVTFGLDANGAVSTFENMERIPWFERRAVQVALAGLFLIAFVTFGFRRDLAALASLTNVAFLIGLVAILSTMPSYALMLGYSALLRAVLLLPLFSLGVTAWYLARLVTTRAAVQVPRAHRGRAALYLCVSALFFVWLNHWNLLGYRS